MITLGRAFGIPVRVDRSWFIVFALVACSLALVYFPRALPAAPAVALWAWGVGAAVLLFASLLAHELAHARTAHHYGIRVESITLHLLGGVSQMVEEPPTPRAELLIAAAGPVTSAALAGLAFGARALVGGPTSALVLFGYLGAANLVVAVFNLLPGYPLDGGRILRAALWAWRGSFGWATRVASTIGRITGLLLAGFGAANAVGAGEFVGGLWLVMVGIFVYQSARDAGRLGEIRERLAPLEVEQIMGAPPAATTLGDGQSLGRHDSAWLAFQQLAGTGTRVVRVVEDGRVVGAVDRERLKESLARRDGDQHVA
jgi:Zn-dependent protease